MNQRHITSSLLALCGLATLHGCAPDTATLTEPEELGSHQQAELAYNPGAGWTLAWSDEFDGTSLNANNWNVLTSNYDPVTNNCNFGTGELEFPRAQNVTVSGGKLILTAERTADNPVDSRCTGYGTRAFYSGRIHTKGKVERRYASSSPASRRPRATACGRRSGRSGPTSPPSAGPAAGRSTSRSGTPMTPRG